MDHSKIIRDEKVQIELENKVPYYLQLLNPTAATSDAYILRGTICLYSQSLDKNPKIVDSFLNAIISRKEVC
jgi:hypothetical protein